MTVSAVLLMLALISVTWGICSSIVILSYLKKRGHKINFFLLRVLIIKYVDQYRTLTQKESGRIGPWFYSFVAAMSLALVSAIAGLVLR